MASINKIVPGQTLYDVKRNSGIRAFRSKYSVWPVLVESVDIDGGFIIARWNVVNSPKKMSLKSIKNLRVKPPKEK